MRTQRELFEDWQLKCAIMRDVGSVIQNDFERLPPTKEDLIQWKEQFAESYSQVSCELTLLCMEIQEYIQQRIDK